jgi:hypothetical protein
MSGFSPKMYRLYYKWLRIITPAMGFPATDGNVAHVDKVLIDNFGGMKKRSMTRKQACLYMENIQLWAGENLSIVLPGEGIDAVIPKETKT